MNKKIVIFSLMFIAIIGTSYHFSQLKKKVKLEEYLKGEPSRNLSPYEEKILTMVKSCLNLTAGSDNCFSEGRSRYRFYVERDKNQGYWYGRDTIDEMTDKKSLIINVRANNFAPDSVYKPKTPILNFTCEDSTLSAHVNWWNRIAHSSSKYTKLLVRYDSEQAFSDTWSVSTDSKGTFVFEPSKFLKKLAMHKQLSIRISPKDRPSITAIFPLEGLDYTAKKYLKSCLG